jgi:hypothetical protein
MENKTVAAILSITGLAAVGYAIFNFQKDGLPPVDMVKNGQAFGMGLGLFAISYLLSPEQFSTHLTFNRTT